MAQPFTISRRTLIATSGAAFASSLAMPAIVRASARPTFTHGVRSGDVDATSGMIWTRVDRPARVLMEYDTTDRFTDPSRLAPLDALSEGDFAVKRLLDGLPSDQDIFFRFVAEDLSSPTVRSEPIVGRFRTAPASRRGIRFAWSGDTAGQGFGIDAEGMLTYATVARHEPDFFIHSGDAIYADGPLQDEVALHDGSTWKNLVITDAKRKVAETLDEFRGQWKYNLLDPHLVSLHAQTPVFHQWDDHEVTNNWSPSRSLLEDDRYREKSVPLLTARARRAFHEMTPVRYEPTEPGRIYRRIAYGPLLDVFFLDFRSYRGPNYLAADQDREDARNLLGDGQLAWLKRELTASRATWKVIAADMPIGLVSWEATPGGLAAEAVANGDDGDPRGREREFADLLRYIKTAGITNTVWLTADVHYTAAHHYDPSRAGFQDFEPFWEFVSGPLHAGSFAQKELDRTFGPEVRFVKAPAPGLGASVAPSAGFQFFGLVDIDGTTAQLTVRLMDRGDTELWRITLDPALGA